MKWLRRGAWALLLVVLVVVAALWIYSRRVLPMTSGTMPLQGVRGEVRIERDADGIPTIKAASRDDAMFGLGYVHAQDRLWQLETHKRIGSGRLAESFGESALETDKFLRALRGETVDTTADREARARAWMTRYAFLLEQKRGAGRQRR